VHDALGSVRQVLNDQGGAPPTQQYDAWGVPSNRSAATPFGFTGELQDAHSGLVYLRARWYDADDGRFVARDPFPGVVEYPYSLHPYQYANSNPVRYRDASGKLCIPDWVPGVGGQGCAPPPPTWTAEDDAAFLDAHPEIDPAQLPYLPGHQYYTPEQAHQYGQAYAEYQSNPAYYTNDDLYAEAAAFSEYFYRAQVPRIHPADLEALFLCLQDRVNQGMATEQERSQFFKIGLIFGVTTYAGTDAFFGPHDDGGGGGGRRPTSGISYTPGGLKITGHARESLLRHGFREPFDKVDDIIANYSRKRIQRDGATVYIQKAKGSGQRYNIATVGDEGLVTAMQNLSRHELQNLGRNHGYDPSP